MIYKVLEIREDLDYGCEERNEDKPLLSEAVLEDTDGEKRYLKMSEALFQERGIIEGDRVYIDEYESLQKAITSPDWTKDFSSKDVDVSRYIQNINDLISGRKQKWVCPFCGGTILYHGKKENCDHIACDSCDMSIDVEAESLDTEGL